MSQGSGDEMPEIVIVRRRVVDDTSAGKAGAWKIAYADFVTAMMAFFLVMWLINASNEETRSQVASYFNPIKLTDNSTGPRSLKDMKDTHSPQTPQAGETTQGFPPGKKDARDEAEMMANPSQSLDRVAKTASQAEAAGLDSAVEAAPSLKPDKSNPGVGDPFDPKSWEKADRSHALPDDLRPDEVEPVEKRSADPPGGEKDRLEKSKAIRQEIAHQLGKTAKQLEKDIEVKATADGMLISLTESAEFEMFRTGSAEPEPQMLRLVEAIATALKSKPGIIVVRGHTDSRPYRNRYYDNWQLSTARANLARYMLIRGGLEEGRIRRVEGVADLEPKNAKDPQAPENRRIEIFVSKEGP